MYFEAEMVYILLFTSPWSTLPILTQYITNPS